MKTFKDTTGHTWEISLTISAIKRVKSFLNIDLLSLEVGDPPLITRLGTDVCLLCDVIFVLIKSQADEAKVSDEQFGAALGGKAIMDAHTAFYDELTDFFKGLGRKDLVKAVMTQQKLIEMVISKIETDIGELDLQSVINGIEQTPPKQTKRKRKEQKTPGNSSTS